MAENDLVIGVQTSPRKSYNPFDSDDEDTDVKNNIDGYDIKSFETSPDSLTFHLDSSDLSWEEAIIGHSRLLSNPNSADASNEEVLYRKDSELFTDKTITECELPELFSYKDNGFHPVKDIGIDEGVPTHDKVWIKSLDNHDSKNMSTVLASNDNVDGDVLFTNDVEKHPFAQGMAEELVKESGVVREALEKPYPADECGTDDMLIADEFEHNSSKKQDESKFILHTDELVKSDDVVNDKKDPQVGEKDKVDCQKVMTDNEVPEEEHCKDSVPLEHVEPSVIHEVETTMQTNEAQLAEKSSAQPSIVHEAEATMESNEAQHAEISPAQPSIMHEVESTMESNESQSEEPSSALLVEHPALQEPADNVNNNALSYNSKVESGSIILDFNAAATSSEMAEKEFSQKNEAVEKPPAAQSMSRDDVGSLPGSILDCGTDRRVHGETSFSAAMPPPSSITYMGPVAQSGNISLRSESSAGSTRSFAFPVLQAEWNTSPVRMAKADQRNLRKQKGWAHSFMCCKF
uniref:Uncharacterized protein n=1 Tax=Chenopodium quinoa TaxID=63459 RepID=A0A803KVJ9_CHEQI